MDMNQENISFEAAFRALQEVIERLEESELPLEEAVKLYEEGVRLSKSCQQLLDRAQLRVTQLNDEENADSQL